MACYNLAGDPPPLKLILEASPGRMLIPGRITDVETRYLRCIKTGKTHRRMMIARGIAKLVRHRNLTPAFRGSNPCPPDQHLLSRQT